MKLSKKDKKLIVELIHCELYQQEQQACVLYEQDRVDRLKKLKLLMQVQS